MLTSSLRWHHLLSPGSSGITDLWAGLSRCYGNHFSQAVDIRATQGPDDLVGICHRFKLSGTAGQRSLVFCTRPIGGADRVHPRSRYQTYICIILSSYRSASLFCIVTYDISFRTSKNRKTNVNWSVPLLGLPKLLTHCRESLPGILLPSWQHDQCSQSESVFVTDTHTHILDKGGKVFFYIVLRHFSSEWKEGGELGEITTCLLTWWHFKWSPGQFYFGGWSAPSHRWWMGRLGWWQSLGCPK